MLDKPLRLAVVYHWEQASLTFSIIHKVVLINNTLNFGK